MKRRRFVQSLLVAPAGPAALAVAQQSAPQQPPGSQPNTPARQLSRQPQSVPKLDVVQADVISQTEPRFFNDDQFATLQKLGSVLMPPMKGKPGATEAHAPEFLDFLVSVSPEDRQKLYREGLDSLNKQAKKKFKKPFPELDATEADAILRPLLVVRPWPEDFPEDPLQHFVAQAHDLRTATMNSREWSTSGKAGPLTGRGFTGSGFYWKPIDPITEI
jgi:hypothetical protein